MERKIGEQYFLIKKIDIYNMIVHCKENVPYYKLKWNFTIPKLEDFTYEWFKRTIPLLEKNDVRDDGKRFISSTVDAKDLIVETTSGSEGKPMKCYKSQNEKLRCAMDLWEYRKKLIPDLSPKDKFVHFYVTRRQKGDFLTLPIIYEKNILHLSLFDLSLKTLFDYWDEILKFKPRWMHGVTSTLYSLACVIKEYNLPRYSFDLVELTGEFLDEDKKKLMEDVFGCIIANQYGAREFWTIAYGCDNSKLHVNENSVFLEEVFNKQTRETEIVVTSLKNNSWPLIRYKLGDLGGIKENCCNCKILSPYILELKEGRASEVCKFGDVTLSRTFFSHIIRRLNEEEETECIKQYQIVKVSSKKLEIRLVGLKEKSEKIKEIFRCELEKFITDIQLKINFVDCIVPDNNSGKVKEFIDLGEE